MSETTCPVGTEFQWTTLGSDDFESGAALIPTYGDGASDGGYWSPRYGIESAAGAGKDGSWGVQTTGSAYNQQFGYFTWRRERVSVSRLRVSLDVDWAHRGTSFVAADGIYVQDGPFQSVVDVQWGYRNYTPGYEDRLTRMIVYYWGAGQAGPFYSVANVVEPGRWVRVVLDVTFATVTGGVANNDGAISITVDGTVVFGLTDIPVASLTGLNTGTNAITAVSFAPMGHCDNLLIESGACVPIYVPPPPPAVNNVAGCCPVATGGNEARGTGTGAVGSTATHWGSTPGSDDTRLAVGWVSECAGGGAVPSSADLSDAESWDPQ